MPAAARNQLGENRFHKPLAREKPATLPDPLTWILGQIGMTISKKITQPLDCFSQTAPQKVREGEAPVSHATRINLERLGRSLILPLKCSAIFGGTRPPALISLPTFRSKASAR
jgi:hypothetical protein